MSIIMSPESQAGPWQNATPAKPVATDRFAQLMSDFFSPSGGEAVAPADEDEILPPAQQVAPPDAPGEEAGLDVAADVRTDAESEPEMDPSGMWPPVPQLMASNPALLSATPLATQVSSVTSGVQSGRPDPIPLAFVAQGWGESSQSLEAAPPSVTRDIPVGAVQFQTDRKPAFVSAQVRSLIQEPIQENTLTKAVSVQSPLEGAPGQLPLTSTAQSATQLQMVAALPKETTQIRTAEGFKTPGAPPNPDNRATPEGVANDRLQIDPRLAQSSSPASVAGMARPVEVGAAQSGALASVDGAFGLESALQGGGERMSTASVSGIDVKTAAPAQVASAAAQQMAVAVQKNPAGVTEMILNPEELGRVKLAMATSDGAVTLTITTERPETQDLMRRHIEVLAQELRQLGFGDVGFSFRNQGGQEPSDETGGASVDGSAVEAEIPVMQVAAAETSGLDLRL